MDDRVFIKLAREVGYPSARSVARLRQLQLERSKKGTGPSLLELAREEDCWSPKERRNFDRWAEQIARKAQTALVEDEEPAPTSGAVSGRVVAASALEPIAKDDEEARADLDELIARREKETGRPAIADRVFLKLAKRVAYPRPREIAKLRKLQLAPRGTGRSLFELAREEKLLSAQQQKNYDRWAGQIEAKAKAALVEDGSADEASESAGVSGRVVAQSAEEIEVAGDEARADLDELIRGLEPDIADRVFLKLAKRSGYPDSATVARLRERQLERTGDEVSLFLIAREEKVLSPKQQRNYDRWAEQLAAKAKAALVEDDERDPVSGQVSLSGRVVVADPAEVSVSGEEQKAELDDLIARFSKKEAAPSESDASGESRAASESSPASPSDASESDVGAKSESEATTAPLASPAPAKPTVPRTASGKTRSASGKVRTPSAGRERALAGPPRQGQGASGALVAGVGIAFVALVGLLLASSGSTPSHDGEGSPPVVAVASPAAEPSPATERPTSDPRPSGRGLFGDEGSNGGNGGAGGGDDAAPAVGSQGGAVDASARAQARELVEQAWACLEQGDREGAQSCLEEARRLDPGNPDVAALARKLSGGDAGPGEAAGGEQPRGGEAPRAGDPGPGPAASPRPKRPTPPPRPAASPSPEPEDSPAPAGSPQPGGPQQPGVREGKPGEPNIERGPDGKITAKYGTDAQGRKNGDYVAFHANGTPSVRAHYVAGQLHGSYSEFWPSGKPKKKAQYVHDRLDGRVLEWDEKGKVTADARWVQGEPVSPRSIALISTMLSEIDRSPVEDPKGPVGRKVEFAPMEFQAQARAVRRLRQHRWLAGVPWDVDLSFEYGEFATAGAKLLEILGRLEHTPKKPPGCSDSLYDMGYKGTSQGNLFMGVSDLVECIDGWMDDSDESNVDRVGHRRWCLNPPMKKTAIGQQSGKWTVLFAHDKSRTGFEEPQIVCYPAQGFFPTTHIHADAAWSISLGERFAPPGPDVKVTVSPCDSKLKKGAPLEQQYFNINNDGFGQPRCIIFRMKGTSYRAGSGYWVEVKGLKDRSGQPYPLGYYVEFFTP